MNLVNDPKQCSFCDKLYCSKCIQHWLKQNQNCPNCKEPFVSYPRINKIDRVIIVNKSRKVDGAKSLVWISHSFKRPVRAIHEAVIVDAVLEAKHVR